jgi:hypothetical protein
MFPFFPLFSEPARIKAKPVRRGSREPQPSPRRQNLTTPAADMKARLRRAAKKAFRLMGED